jgi:hypothetical protein
MVTGFSGYHVAHAGGHRGGQPVGVADRRLDLQRHAVVGHLAFDHQPGAADLGVAAHDLGHLARVHEHAAHLGGLVGAAQPALDAHVGAAGRAGAGQHGRQVAGAEADQRVVGLQHGDDHLADLAVGHRVAGAGAHDLDDHALVEHQPSRAGVS